MTTPGQPSGVETRKWKAILRIVAIRAAAYAILCLIVIFSLVDVHSLLPRSSVRPTTSEELVGAGPPWPHFRGVAYDGRSAETELADAWPAKGPPVLWTREIGAGYSGVIVQGGRAYTQAQGLTDQRVLALDADTGQTIWEHGYGWLYQAGGMFPGPRATPTYSNGRIYFAAPNGLVGCLSAADGHPIWSLNVIQRFKGQGAGFGYACSPVVEDGMVILPVGGPSASVVALDAETGAIRWASGGAPASYSSPLPLTFQGRRQVAVFLQSTLAGFDLQTGRQLWEQSYPKANEEHSAPLLYEEPYLRAMQAYRAGSDLFRLEAGAPTENVDGVPVTRIKKVRHDSQPSNDIASSVLIDGFVYGFDLREMQASGGRPSHGTFRCIDFRTGEVRWSSDQPGQAGFVAADGKLLMLNDSGQVLLVRINPSRYEELARVDVFPGETCWTPPSLQGGRIYLRSPTKAACLFVGKPQRMTPRQQALARSVAVMPRAAPTNITWMVGAEREYPFELPDARELMRWYLYSIGALAVAALLAALAYGILSRFGFQWLQPAWSAVFFTALFVFGIIVTPLANRRGSAFVFTWPLALIAAHQVALAAVIRSKQLQKDKTADWLGLAAAGSLVVVCVLYFKFTRQVTLIPAWYFLVLLPAAWPLAVPAARRLLRQSGLAGNVVWMVGVFSVYFWIAGAVMLLRTAHG